MRAANKNMRIKANKTQKMGSIVFALILAKASDVRGLFFL